MGDDEKLEKKMKELRKVVRKSYKMPLEKLKALMIPHSDTALKKILDRLRYPATLKELTLAAYPKSKKKCKNYKSRVRKHLKILDNILMRKRKIKLSKKGKRELIKLIKKYFYSNFDITDRELMPKKFKASNNSISEFIDEIEDKIDASRTFLDLNNLGKLIIRLSDVSGSRLIALDESFRYEIQETCKKHAEPSNELLYWIDINKVFELFIDANNIKVIKGKLDNPLFKNYLVGWLLIKLKKEKFTCRNFQKTLSKVLKGYQNDMELSYYLNK